MTTKATTTTPVDTPEANRKLRKAFLRRSDIDLPGDMYQRKRSIGSAERRKSSAAAAADTTPQQSQRTSFTSSGGEDSESSRKSSLSSGRKKPLLFPSGGGGGEMMMPVGGSSGSSPKDKQFAVTFFVSENDKTKLVDILHKAKTVISKKVEKVMGRKPKSNSIASAEALTSILENWVSQEEEADKTLDSDLQDLIVKQTIQIEEMAQKGLDPPVRYYPIPTVVSPVPEESEEDAVVENGRDDGFLVHSDDDDDNHKMDEQFQQQQQEDITVQELVDGGENFLRPPPVRRRFQLTRSPSPIALFQQRSLSPCDGVPRPNFHCLESNFTLRRPSSHYDESCQAASSRPVSPRFPPSMGEGDEEDRQSKNNKIEPAKPAEEMLVTVVDSISSSSPAELARFIQRPESMTVPIGGVWRPDESDDAEEKGGGLFGAENVDGDDASSQIGDGGGNQGNVFFLDVFFVRVA